jgi:GTP cyclohydrolase I
MIVCPHSASTAYVATKRVRAVAKPARLPRKVAASMANAVAYLQERIPKAIAKAVRARALACARTLEVALRA